MVDARRDEELSELDALCGASGVGGIANGVCADCTARPELLSEVLGFYQHHIRGGELRVLDLAAVGGHA